MRTSKDSITETPLRPSETRPAAGRTCNWPAQPKATLRIAPHLQPDFPGALSGPKPGFPGGRRLVRPLVPAGPTHAGGDERLLDLSNALDDVIAGLKAT